MWLVLALGVPAVVGVHEAGHYIAARMLGYRPRLVACWKGVGIEWGNAAVPLRTRGLVTLAGPAASLLYGAAVGWAGVSLVALMSLELAVLNLLPLPRSDGLRALRLVTRP
jgi:Zn-dependent protease